VLQQNVVRISSKYWHTVCNIH